MAVPTRQAVDCIQLSVPIVYGGRDQSTVDVYAVRLQDLEDIKFRRLFDAVGMTPAYTAAVVAATDESPAPDPAPDLAALLECASDLRRLLERVTPLAPPQVASIDTRDLMAAAMVVVPLLMPSGATGTAAR